MLLPRRRRRSEAASQTTSPPAITMCGTKSSVFHGLNSNRFFDGPACVPCWSFTGRAIATTSSAALRSSLVIHRSSKRVGSRYLCACFWPSGAVPRRSRFPPQSKSWQGRRRRGALVAFFFYATYRVTALQVCFDSIVNTCRIAGQKLFISPKQGLKLAKETIVSQTQACRTAGSPQIHLTDSLQSFWIYIYNYCISLLINYLALPMLHHVTKIRVI